MKIEIHLIVPDHLGDVLAKTSENACVGDLATKFASVIGTIVLTFECTFFTKYQLMPKMYWHTFEMKNQPFCHISALRTLATQGQPFCFATIFKHFNISLGQCKARPLNFVLVCFLFFIFCFSTPTDRTMHPWFYLPQSQRSVTKVHWPPMNKFVCKLHGYIVYFMFDFSCWFSWMKSH